MMRLVIRLCGIGMLAFAGIGPAHAQPGVPPAAVPPAPKPGEAAVGANDIFQALTEPGRAGRIEALHTLRDALAHHPDPATLESAREKLDSLLQSEQQTDSAMPPALVMSGIASRIEAAMAALETARQDSAPPPPHQPPPWLIPGLATAAGTLAVALLACLIALASQGGQPAGSADEIHDALAKIRRKLDEAASLAAQPQDLSETSAEASDAVHEAAHAVSRLGSAAKEAEHQLRTSIDAAEARLHAAAGMAGEFEHWIEAMPTRLAEAVSAMQEAGLGGIDDAVGKLAACAAQVDLAGEKLPGVVAGLAAMDDARLQMARSADAMAGGRAAMEQAAASLPGALASAVATTAALSEQAMRGATNELANTADLAAEMTNLAFGHAMRLEDVVAHTASATQHLGGLAEALTPDRLGQIFHAAQAQGLAAIEKTVERLASTAAAIDTAADGLAVLADAAPGLAETLAAAAEGVRSHMAESAHTMVAGRAALTSAADAAQAAHTALGSEVAQLGDVLTHTKTLPAQIAALAEAAHSMRTAAETTATTAPPAAPVGLDQLDQALASLAEATDLIREGAARLANPPDSPDAHGAARSADQLGAVLEALAARADAAIALLPAEATALAAAAAELRAETAELEASAERMAGFFAREAGAISGGTAQALAQFGSACARLETLVGAASAGQADTSRSLENLATLQELVATLAREACATAEHANTLLVRIEPAETAAFRAPSESAEPAPNEMHALLTVHAERLATLLDSGALVAARLEAASSSIAQQEAPAPIAAPLPELSIGLPDPDERLAGLEAAILRVQDAATRLQEGAAAHEAATARVTQVAATVAALAEATAPPSARPTEVTLTRLAEMATETGQMQDVAEHLAQAALRGEVPAFSADLVLQTPVLLAAIEASIHRLRGTATALALASDAQRKAA